MSSRPPPPPQPLYSSTAAAPASPMTETQYPPSSVPYALPPPSSIVRPYLAPPRLPPSFPPLSIPPPANRLDYRPYPSYQPRISAAPHYSASRTERWPSVPIDKLLSRQYQRPVEFHDHCAKELPRPEVSPRSPSQKLNSISPKDIKRHYVPPMASPTYTPRRGSEGPTQSSASASSGGTSASKTEPSLTLKGSPGKKSSGRYEIKVRQQPLAARACGFGERDRRVIDPPPIVQLMLRDKQNKGEDSELRYPFNVVHCTLWSADGNTDETALMQADRRTTRRLMGTLVASPFVGVDENDQEGCFFCFPDLSCRTHGKYRLSFVLMCLEVSHLEAGGLTPVVTQVMSDVFTVFTAKDFPGMRASTALTKALKRQGCAISVKKGNEKALAHPREEGNVEEDLADGEPDNGRVKKHRK